MWILLWPIVIAKILIAKIELTRTQTDQITVLQCKFEYSVFLQLSWIMAFHFHLAMLRRFRIVSQCQLACTRADLTAISQRNHNVSLHVFTGRLHATFFLQRWGMMAFQIHLTMLCRVRIIKPSRRQTANVGSISGRRQRRRPEIEPTQPGVLAGDGLVVWWTWCVLF